MSKRVRLDEEALEELDAAVAWYQAQRPGLGMELIEAVEVSKAALVGSSSGVPFTEPSLRALGVRRLLVDRFPYALVFVESETEIRVLAVAHTRRRPGYWRSRL